MNFQLFKKFSLKLWSLIMSEAHRKKKQPEQVRRNLLDYTAKIAAEQGIAKVTIEAVAKSAGITKGGLLHHFSSKRALIDAMFADMIDQFDQRIDAYMAQDSISQAQGRFTRAYVAVMLADENFDPSTPWQALCLSTISEPSSYEMWENWLNDRLNQHRSTDSDPMLEIVRLAADGAWFAVMTTKNEEALEYARNIRKRLIAMTKQL
jgi:AcrR family transcriptional regulator